MVMLSELLRYRVSDANGATMRIADLGIGLLEHDYPPVAHLYFTRDREPVQLPWSEVTDFNKPGKGILVRDLSEAVPFDADDSKSEVLLKHDVLDGLIVDLLGRKTTRASDLELLPDDGVLRLRAVDAGLSAMLRRITRGFYRAARRKDLTDWKYVEFLRGDPAAVESGAGYRLRIGRLTGGEIAQLAELLPYLHAAELLTLLPDDKAADALQAMSIERQQQVIEEFADDDAVELLSRMSPDRAADLIGRLGVETSKKLLGRIPQKQRERVIKLLQYPEDSVGGAMVNNIVCFGRRTETSTAREKLRLHSRNGDVISIIFVTENSDSAVLVGTIAIRSLLDADGRLEEIMDPFVATLNPFDRAQDAAYRLIGAQVQAMPVTDVDGFLLGAMTIDAAIGLVAPGEGLRTLKVFA